MLPVDIDPRLFCAHLYLQTGILHIQAGGRAAEKIKNKKILQRGVIHTRRRYTSGVLRGPKIDRLGPLTTEADHSSGIDRMYRPFSLS